MGGGVVLESIKGSKVLLLFCHSHVCKWRRPNIRNTSRYYAVQFNNRVNRNVMLQFVTCETKLNQTDA